MANEVYRIYDPINGTHTYTIDLAEVNGLVAKGYINEGAVFDSDGPNKVYRFLNTTRGSYFYTTSELEKSSIAVNNPDYLLQPGSGFNAYLSPTPGKIPTYRFYRPGQGTHLYTTNTAEVEFVKNQLASLYVPEGIAYYVDPLG
jgi:hypothetical protein